MGPRSVTADRMGVVIFIGLAPLVLQWGRGLSPRIGGRYVPELVGKISCFNGAAVCHRGSAPLPRSAGVPTAAASMGPRSVTADRCSAAKRRCRGRKRFNGAAVCHRGSDEGSRLLESLRLKASMGPRSVTADRRAGPHTRARNRRASMGPRSVTADREYPSRELAADIGASMGPRSVTADRYLYSDAPEWIQRASMGPRSVTADRPTRSSSSVKNFHQLQWGRGLSPRIGGRRSHGLGYRFWCFNGAAVCHRGSVSSFSAWAWP